ncbi:hypothetical protein QP027_08210 [Corynebacterium breve]|uniref:Aminoglycoside phosphotransferase domain-containing protein n=1 Tax=Corynebacterium breve TaxID=3049799 RepID=A0ABY8VBQ7_9CORY|nr:hypothetical protein [Corynebacterium breve]WIM67106.1 hypothetical protein QP027_08210 [Corynebacterium breve]
MSMPTTSFPGTPRITKVDGALRQEIVDQDGNDVTHLSGDYVLDLLFDTCGTSRHAVESFRGMTCKLRSTDQNSVQWTIHNTADEHVADLKLYRRLEPGINPEADILSNASFVQTPTLEHTLSCHIDHIPVTIGLITSPLPGDSAADITQDFVSAGLYSHHCLQKLGEIVRVMHDAMLLGFSTTAIDAAHYREKLTSYFDSLIQQAPDLQKYKDFFDRLCAAIDGEVSVQRVHGQLTVSHLQSDLNDWWITGFGGNPELPYAQRREMNSPLWDLATLQVSNELIAGDPVWSDMVCAAMFEGYGGSVCSPYLPPCRLSLMPNSRFMTWIPASPIRPLRWNLCRA